MSGLPFSPGFVAAVNRRVTALIDSPRLGRFARRSLVTVSYVGRRSGRTISTPVGYRRDGETVVIGVVMPEKKVWWRNFLGAGEPLTLHFDSGDRTGHAVAAREGKRVAVTVRLDPVRAAGG